MVGGGGDGGEGGGGGKGGGGRRRVEETGRRKRQNRKLLRWFLPHCYLSCKFDVKRLMYGEIETNVNGGPSRGSSSASLGAPNH